MRLIARFVVSGLSCVAGLYMAGCNIRPIVLDDPLESLQASAKAPIDAMTTSSLGALSYSYLVLPGAEEDVTTSPEMATQLEPRALSISDAVLISFQNNLAIQVTDLGRQIAADRIEAEKGIYDLVIGATATRAKAKRKSSTSAIDPLTGRERDQDDVTLPEYDTRRDGYSAGVSQLVDTGGRASINALHTRNAIEPGSGAPSPSHEQDWEFRFDQPLLRDFGPGVTRAGIRIAQNNKAIAHQDWRLTVMKETAALMNRYWDLVFAVNQARVTRLSLRQAENLLDINKKKVEVGLLASIDVLEAEAQVAARREQLIADLANINNIQDDLKRRLRLKPGHEMWNYALLPTETPSITDVVVDVQMCLADAYNFRPEIERLRYQAHNLEQSELVGRNALLPSLDAFYSYGLQGLDHTASGATRRATNAEEKGWATGLEFSFPLQNRQSRYQLKQINKQIDQLKLLYQEQLESVAQEVRLSARGVDTARQRAEAARSQSEYEAAKLDAEIKRYENGTATSQDVLDYQNDLARARSNYLSALVNFNKAVIALDVVKGTILQRYNIIEAER